jgi:hypothetical protein
MASPAAGKKQSTEGTRPKAQKHAAERQAQRGIKSAAGGNSPDGGRVLEGVGECAGVTAGREQCHLLLAGSSAAAWTGEGDCAGVLNGASQMTAGVTRLELKHCTHGADE